MPETASTATTPRFTGLLHCFVAFDWGEEVNLDLAQRLVPAQMHALPRKSRTPVSIAYQAPPLRFDLAPASLALPVVGIAQAEVDLMVFDFGAVSVEMQIPFQLSAADLTRLSGELCDPSTFIKAARDASASIFDRLRPSIVQPHWIDLSEEYFVFQIIPGPETPTPAQLLAQSPGWVAGLVRLEAEPLSEGEITEALRMRLSYGPHDLMVTDWTAALVVDRDCAEILETMAYANLQLLEFRHIDNRLDERLKTAYGMIQQLAQTNRPIWRRHARSLRDLGALKVELNAMFEHANNALTLVGDPYVARVYHQVAGRFHLDEWGQNIRRSIAVLEGIYQVMSTQAASYRAETLEITVVLLIVIEIILAIIGH